MYNGARLGSISPGPVGGYWAFSASPNSADDVDIWLARDDSLPTPRPFVATAGVWEGIPRVSPNRRLLAYVSREGGQDNVYIQPIPGPGARVRVFVYAPSFFGQLTYDVLPSGREFLMLKAPQSERTDTVTLMTNWPATLGRARTVAPAPVP